MGASPCRLLVALCVTGWLAALGGAPSLSHAQSDPEYGAVANVERSAAGERRMQEEELRDMPGAFGDPYRTVTTMPSMVPLFSGVPYVYVRGAPPGGTRYYYDDVPMPALFHLALGPAVIHPSMVGPVKLYSAVAPAAFGGHTGAVIASEGPELPLDELAGEAELRLIDVNGQISTPVEGGVLSLSGRYGYPGLVLSAIEPDITLIYWDYQARYERHWGRDKLRLVWLGAFDVLEDRLPDEVTVGPMATTEDRDELPHLRMQFHRIDLRLTRQLGRWQLGSGLLAGYEHTVGGDRVEAEQVRLAPRLFFRHRGRDLAVHGGLDFNGSVGHLRSPPPGTGLMFPQNGTLAARALAAEPQTDDLRYADRPTRGVAGAFVDLSLPLSDSVTLAPGLRGGLWLAGAEAQAAADPRLRATFQLAPGVEAHLAGGLAHQPASFILQLPGLGETFADTGLQRALQSEAGVAFELPGGLDIETQLFANRFTNMLYPEVFFGDINQCDDRDCFEGGHLPRADATVYGLELFVRRDLQQRLSGWLSYTLASAQAESERGGVFVPAFDIRHLANLVMRYRIGEGWVGGFSLHARTGRMDSEQVPSDVSDDVPVYHEQRMPGFYRLDLSLSYRWRTDWGRLRVAFEWFNVTFNREPTGIDCADTLTLFELAGRTCVVAEGPLISLPSLGLRAEF